MLTKDQMVHGRHMADVVEQIEAMEKDLINPGMSPEARSQFEAEIERLKRYVAGPDGLDKEPKCES